MPQIPGLPLPIDDLPPIGGPPAAPGGGFNWSSLIPYGINAGLNFLGNRMATAPVREQNEWLRKQQEQELARRNMLQGMAAPSMLAALGYRDPQQIQQMSAQIGGTGPAGSSGSGPQRYAVGAPQRSSASGALGAIGAGGELTGGALSLMGMGSIGGPIGLVASGGAALGSMIANKIGAGRRAANAFVGGAQKPFHQDLAQISQTGMTDPKGAGQQLLQAWNDFYASAQQEIAKGGKQALVAKQALATPNLINTVRTMAQQLGVQIPTLPTLGA